MTVTQNLLLVVGSIALILALMYLLRRIAGRFAIAPEMQRKIIHVMTGLYALALPFIFTDLWPVFLLVALSVATMLVLRLARFSSDGLSSVLHAVKRPSYGEIYLSLAVGLLFFRSQGAPVLYVLPILILTLSDAAAALVGSAYGSRRYLIADGVKSLEGMAACFTVTWLVAMIALMLMSDIAELNVIVLSFLIAAFATLIEADSWRGLDNLFVPIGVHLLLATHLTSDPMTLLMLAGLFIMATGGILTAVPYLGLTPHAARVVIALIFLICTYSTVATAILPLLAVAAHLLARAWRKSEDEFPDLEFLGSAALVSLAWLFAGEMSGRTTVAFYGLTFGLAAAALFGLALTGHWRALAIPGGAALIAIVHGVTSREIPEPIGWWAIGISVAAVMAVTLALPRLFAHRRAIGIFALSLVSPVTLFLIREIST
ncbi:diacylglycerol/polyprenol kinase family protein [Taklimakanibacter lacteus]|uniref:diacylglycerol/polyprenol kinase family protein n=1 Tax=Taklimakanibacter lacteus TaxID=2268456 RepID=UPI000E667336